MKAKEGSAIFAAWFSVAAIPDIVRMCRMLRQGYGLSGQQYLLGELPGLILFAVFLTLAVHFMTDQKEWSSLLRGLPMALLMSAVLLAGDVLAIVSSKGNTISRMLEHSAFLWIAALAVQVVLLDVFMMLLVSAETGRKLSALLVKTLVMLPVIAVLYFLTDLVPSLVGDIRFIAENPLLPICVRAIIAIPDAVISVLFLGWYVKEKPDDTRKEKQGMLATGISYGAVVVAFVALLVTGMVQNGKKDYLHTLEEELQLHYTLLTYYSANGDLFHVLTESDIINADILLWDYSIEGNSSSRTKALEYYADDDYTRLLTALTASNPVTELENLIYRTDTPDTDTAMALLQLYARQNKLEERQEKLRKELILSLAGRGDYIDYTENPVLLMSEAGKNALEDPFQNLAQYQMDFAAFRYASQVMQKEDRMSIREKVDAIRRFYDRYYDPDDYVSALADVYFSNLLATMDWESESATYVNGLLVDLAEGRPEHGFLQYMAAEALLLRTQDNYPVELVKRQAAAAERYLDLYRNTYETYRQDADTYELYEWMAEGMEDSLGLADMDKYDAEGMDEAEYFTAIVYVRAAMYDSGYSEKALELLEGKEDYTAQNIIANLYFNVKKYEECIRLIDETIHDLTLTDGQLAEQYDLRALANNNLGKLADSLTDAAHLAELLDKAEGEDLTEIDWMLTAYAMRITSDYDRSFVKWTDPKWGKFTTEEWAITEGNEMLKNYLTVSYIFSSKAYHGEFVNGAGETFLGADGRPVTDGYEYLHSLTEQMLAENPALSSIWYLKGGLYHESGAENKDAQDYDKAIECFEKALETDPTNAKVLYEEASTYFDMGDDFNKSEYYEKALELALKVRQYYGENADHEMDAFGMVIHNNRLIDSCRDKLGIK